MTFSSVQLAEIDGLLDVNRDFCKFEMQQSHLGKSESDQPAPESEESGAALPKPARKRYGFGACSGKGIA